MENPLLRASKENPTFSKKGLTRAVRAGEFFFGNPFGEPFQGGKLGRVSPMCRFVRLIINARRARNAGQTADWKK